MTEGPIQVTEHSLPPVSMTTSMPATRKAVTACLPVGRGASAPSWVEGA